MNDLKPENPPAFPGLEIPAGGLPGMTLRDYFAAKALPALIQTYTVLNGVGIGSDHIQNNVPTLAYKFADAMLKARIA